MPRRERKWKPWAIVDRIGFFPRRDGVVLRLNIVRHPKLAEPNLGLRLNLRPFGLKQERPGEVMTLEEYKHVFSRDEQDPVVKRFRIVERVERMGMKLEQTPTLAGAIRREKQERALEALKEARSPEARIVAFLRAQTEPKSTADVRAGAHLKTARCAAALENLRERGVVACTSGTGWTRSPWMWMLKES